MQQSGFTQNWADAFTMMKIDQLGGAVNTVSQIQLTIPAGKYFLPQSSVQVEYRAVVTKTANAEVGPRLNFYGRKDCLIACQNTQVVHDGMQLGQLVSLAAL